jgi:catechol 2,3-dioxygenase-like lactoylglutathione lyase family enzyme
VSGVDVGAVLGRVAPGQFQQAWVVHDIDRAEAAMRDALGCDEFVKIRMDEEWVLRGETVRCGLALAFARSGNMQIELMQPLHGDSVQGEFLARHGPGPHHFGFLVDDLDAAARACELDGARVVMTGAMGNVRIAFLDTVDALGFYLELIEDPTGMIWAMKPWRDEAAFPVAQITPLPRNAAS